MNINEPTEHILEHLTRWETNRAVIGGARAVKLMGEVFMPRCAPDQDWKGYQNFLQRVPFYPAASRTVDGLIGLMHRKKPVLEGVSPTMQLLTDVITAEGLSLNDLAEELTRETLTTNFTGLLVDHPPATVGLTAANAIDEGFRPFLAMYRAESILEVTQQTVKNLKRLTRVRLLEEHGKRVRELTLERGPSGSFQYVVRIHDSANGVWSLTSETVPLRHGAPLNEIPFTIVSTSNRVHPTKGLVDDAVELNLDHYRMSGLIINSHYYSSAPKPCIFGIKPKPKLDAKGQIIPGEFIQPAYSISPGSIWIFDSATDQRVEYLEFSGAGVDSMSRERDHIEDQLATVGARILAAEKAAAEAAETIAIRRASENAVLGGAANSISRKVQDALAWMSLWVDGPQASDAAKAAELTFKINTDYLALPMTSQDITAHVAAWQAGAISTESLFYSFRDRDVFNSALEFDEELKRRQADAAKRAAEQAAQALALAQAQNAPAAQVKQTNSVGSVPDQSAS